VSLWLSAFGLCVYLFWSRRVGAWLASPSLDTPNSPVGPTSKRRVAGVGAGRPAARLSRGVSPDGVWGRERGGLVCQ
jgi:hypothetical protein